MIPAVLLSRSRAFLFVAEAARSQAFLSRAGADFNNFDLNAFKAKFENIQSRESGPEPEPKGFQ